MFFAQTEKWKGKIIRGQRENEKQMIFTLLEQDQGSEKKRKMAEGERYFQCQHDILQKDFRNKPTSETSRLEDGSEVERMTQFSNPNRSNHRCANPFHHVLVEQKAAYLVSREPSITAKGSNQKEFGAFLEKVADSKFNRTLYDWVVGASNKGVEYVHFYYDEMGKLQYTIVPAEQIILINGTPNGAGIKEVIRYYLITVQEGGKEKQRKRVEWWSKDNVTYFTEQEGGLIAMEEGRTNPTGHWTEVCSLGEMQTEEIHHGWGRVPFIPLQNNGKESTDLELIKDLIDAYDLISSEGTNNLLDLVDLYWVIEGYAGETAGAIAKKLQINKAVHISDAGGKVEAKQVELPMEGRLKWLKFLRKDIFHFGMGVDTDTDDLGKAPSGISLKFQYAKFHLKVNGIVPELRGAIYDFFWFMIEDANRQGMEFNLENLEVTLNLNAITDDMETVNVINQSKGLVSKKTLLAKHPFVEDVNAEMVQLEMEEKKNKQMEKESEKRRETEEKVEKEEKE